MARPRSRARSSVRVFGTAVILFSFRIRIMFLLG
jgi:hypothetical protein